MIPVMVRIGNGPGWSVARLDPAAGVEGLAEFFRTVADELENPDLDDEHDEDEPDHECVQTLAGACAFSRCRAQR